MEVNQRQRTLAAEATIEQVAASLIASQVPQRPAIHFAFASGPGPGCRT